MPGTAVIFSVWSAFLTAATITIVSASNSATEPNYVIDILNDQVYVPYPLDVCVSTGVGKPYVQYTCSDDDTYVSKADHGNSDDCSNTSPTVTTILASHSNMEKGILDFNCLGYGSSVIVDMYLPACTIFLGRMYVVPGICHFYAKNMTNFTVPSMGITSTDWIPLYSQTLCNSSYSALSTYAEDTCAATSQLVHLSSVEQCTYYWTAQNLALHTKLKACFLDCQEVTGLYNGDTICTDGTDADEDDSVTMARIFGGNPMFLLTMTMLALLLITYVV